MKNAKVVIGSGFGDEGKGIAIDYFVNHFTKDTYGDLVVRFNGGCQAAHTVKHGPTGAIQHVFHHFGSGTLSDCPTYLSRYFIVNPFIFFKEQKDLLKIMKSFPKMYIHKDCLVTTIFDMYINQMVEKWRDSSKHGSCGVGINETVTRSLFSSDCKLTVTDIQNNSKKILQDFLKALWFDYVPIRLDKLGVPSEHYKPKLDSMDSAKFVDDSIDVMSLFLRQCNVTDDEILNSYENVLFEGAQGLLLDEYHEYFPYVTRSRTGIHNVNEILANFSDIEVELNYITRAYATRHGAGPFLREDDIQSVYPNIVDLTNVPNEFQGSLRFGYLDIDLLQTSITNDLAQYTQNLPTTVQLIITCMDQVGDYVYVYYNNELQRIPARNFGLWMENKFNMPILLNKSDITPAEMERICSVAKPSSIII